MQAADCVGNCVPTHVRAIDIIGLRHEVAPGVSGESLSHTCG